MTRSTISFRQMLVRLSKDGADNPAQTLSQLWIDGRVPIKAEMREYPPNNGHVVDHGVREIDPSTASAFEEAWDRENERAHYRKADGTIFHFIDIHADVNAFEVACPSQTQPGRKSNKEVHRERARDILANLPPGAITVRAVAAFIFEEFGDAPGHSMRVIKSNIADTVRTHKAALKAKVGPL